MCVTNQNSSLQFSSTFCHLLYSSNIFFFMTFSLSIISVEAVSFLLALTLHGSRPVKYLIQSLLLALLLSLITLPLVASILEMVPCPVFWTDGGDSVINIKLVQNAYTLNQHEFTMVNIVDKGIQWAKIQNSCILNVFL